MKTVVKQKPGSEKVIELTVSLNRQPIRVFLRANAAGDIRTVCDILLRGEYDFPAEQFGPVLTIVDVGAHIGMSALRFQQRYPGSRLVCIEAEQENYRFFDAQRA